MGSEVVEVWRRIRSYNESAPIIPAVKGFIDAALLTNMNAFDLSQIEEEEGGHGGGHDSGHDGHDGGHSHGHGHDCDEDHGEGHVGLLLVIENALTTLHRSGPFIVHCWDVGP